MARSDELCSSAARSVIDPAQRRRRGRATCSFDDGAVASSAGSRAQPAASDRRSRPGRWRPGFVDLHCHLREPGRSTRRRSRPARQAAARGGFTTVCAMPNTEPATDTRSIVEYVLRSAARGPAVRVLPIGAVTRRPRRASSSPSSASWPRRAASASATTAVRSPTPSSCGARSSTPSALGLPIIDHCEDPSLARGGVMNEGWVSTRLGLKGQPAAAEEAMVARDIALAELTGGHVHIAHVSTRRRGRAVRAREGARRAGHRRGDAAPPDAHRRGRRSTAAAARSMPAYDTDAQGEPAAAHRSDDVEACSRGWPTARSTASPPITRRTPPPTSLRVRRGGARHQRPRDRVRAGACGSCMTGAARPGDARSSA